MTIGIYMLSFKGSNEVYIGKSVNIENRFTGHKWKLRKGEGALKLQKAFNTYGEPSLQVLCQCKEEELNTEEVRLISEFDSYKNGLNSGPGGDGGPFMEGLANSNSLYSEEDLYNVLYFLSEPVYSIEEIVELTGVSYKAIANIASLKSHKWLKEKYPILYSKIEELKLLNRGSVFNSVNRSSNRIVSPDGKVYEVVSVKEFAKTHSLLDSSVSSVLNGRRPTHKGWHLETYKAPPEFYPLIYSPQGISYRIPFKGAASFAREHNLDQSALRHVLHGNAKSHKGWRLDFSELQKLS